MVFKIGILTYHAPCNFGANLQAYSSACFFLSHGYEVKVINYVRTEDRTAKYCDRKQFQGHWNFSQKILPVTRLVNFDELLSLIDEEQFDVIVLGADAIWNKNDLDVFGMAWLWKSRLKKSIKVVCLSPAFMGRTYLDLPQDKRNEFKDSLLKMSYVNTRDEWTRKKINEEIMGFEYIKKTNPDPVFLLNNLCKELWKPQCIDLQPKKYILISLPARLNQKRFYSIGSLWVRTLKKIVNKNGYKLIELPLPEGVSGLEFDYTVPYPIDPLQWFLWIKNAAGFVGLRFHAIVSCFSSGIPFFSFDSYGWYSRIWSYLNLVGFHILDRKINTSSKIRNLLEGSGLEHLRINGSLFWTVSPYKVFKMLKNTDAKIILDFRNKMIQKFETNMEEMLECVRK